MIDPSSPSHKGLPLNRLCAYWPLGLLAVLFGAAIRSGYGLLSAARKQKTRQVMQGGSVRFRRKTENLSTFVKYPVA